MSTAPIGPPSGIHGHDLALGSRSHVGLVCIALFTRWNRLFLAENMQYAIRSKGDFNYRNANGLMWAGGPGCPRIFGRNG